MNWNASGHELLLAIAARLAAAGIAAAVLGVLLLVAWAVGKL